MNDGMKALAQLDEAVAAQAEVTRIDRPTLHNVVVSRIRDMIIEGQLPPGTRIHEGQLGEQLGVSRTPLREALKVLAMEGLVELVPSRGALVRQLTAGDVKNMLSVLSCLEDLAGRLACEMATDGEIRAVREVHDRMVKFYETRNRLDYFKANQQIHSSLIALTGNDSLFQVHDMLQKRMKRIRFLGHQSEGSWAAALADHEEMISALEARDGNRLSKAMTDHLARTWERIQHAL